MCKRILNIRDNDTYTAADIGKRLNEYFVKHNLKVTNKHYEKHLFLDLCKAEGLEPGKHKGFEFLPIAQKEIDRVKADQGKKTAQPKKIPQPKKAPAITPLEEMAEKTAKEMEKAEAVKTIVMDKADAVKTFIREPEPKAAEADEFEGKRKRFYTDFHYFMKFAETHEERAATMNALANLYGLTKKEG